MNFKFSFLVTVTLALVFLTLEIDKQLAPAGQWSVPIIYRVIIGSYIILVPNLALTIWANAKDRTKPPGNFASAVLIVKEKYMKIEPNANQDSLESIDERPEKIFRQKWDSFELIIQNIIFALQTISLLATHSKLSKNCKYVARYIDNLFFSQLFCADLHKTIG